MAIGPPPAPIARWPYIAESTTRRSPSKGARGFTGAEAAADFAEAARAQGPALHYLNRVKLGCWASDIQSYTGKFLARLLGSLATMIFSAGFSRLALFSTSRLGKSSIASLAMIRS